jgi:hypothetical protein
VITCQLPVLKGDLTRSKVIEPDKLVLLWIQPNRIFSSSRDVFLQLSSFSYLAWKNFERSPVAFKSSRVRILENATKLSHSGFIEGPGGTCWREVADVKLYIFCFWSIYPQYIKF